MTNLREPSPLTATELVDEYFLENRNRLLELAAFLDRLDRADPDIHSQDFRMRVFREAIDALTTSGPERVVYIQHLLSDTRKEPLAALDRKGAVGAFDRTLLRAGFEVRR
jgi:hypothetical protein